MTTVETYAARWSFLDGAEDACAVVTPRMEVVYLNEAARSLVPASWFGFRCWEVFPVRDRTCAARCPAVRSLQNGNEIEYCEETVYPAGTDPVTLGVAVIPLPLNPTGDDERALLVLRPKPAGVDEELFRGQLLADAAALEAPDRD